MGCDEVKAAKSMINEDTSDLSKYFEGFRSIRYLYSYERLYERAKGDILTWNDARESFLFDERQELFWNSHRSYSHFILLSHTIVEYISSRLLLRHFDPMHSRSEMLSVFEEMGQFNRQNMMENLGIIDGGLNADMNDARGVRNDFAHEVDAHFELDYAEHPLVILNRVKNVTAQLVKTLYEEPYRQIINLLERIFSDTFPDDHSTVSTAELIDVYQFETDDGVLYSQQPFVFS